MEHFDVAIIGSGLGGLECGYILAKEGYKVCILEKNRQFGGNLQIFVRDRAIFDTGIHYIGGLDEGQNLNRYFKYFGLMDKLKLKRMDMDGFDVISFSNHEKEYRHAQGYENFIEVLAKDFPKERKAIEEYCDKIKEITQHFPLYNLKLDKKDILNTKIFEINARDYINSVTKDVMLQNVLAGSNPLYAGNGDKTPLYVHALVVNTYIESSWKCVDGGSQIATQLVKSIKKMGGIVRNYARVSKIMCNGDKAEYAELENGERIYAKTFISNLPPADTLDMMENCKIRPAYRHRIRELNNTISVFTLNIVMKENAFPYLNHNIYHYANKDVWNEIDYREDKWPTSCAFFTPYSSRAGNYADSIALMSYMKFEEVQQWSQTNNTIPKNQITRGEDYEEFKHRKSEKLINFIEEKFPGIRSKIKSHYASTPLTFRDYIGVRDGSLYGIEKDAADPLKSFISPKMKVENILLTGQNLNMHGVLGVTVSAVVTCSQLLGTEYLMGKIYAAS
ncbi:MAG: NAD(P)-binding protein [Bacteroidota bacterium]